MNCAEIEILICDYLDGTLSADRKAEVERHFAECPACAELARVPPCASVSAKYFVSSPSVMRGAHSGVQL